MRSKGIQRPNRPRRKSKLRFARSRWSCQSSNVYTPKMSDTWTPVAASNSHSGSRERVPVAEIAGEDLVALVAHQAEHQSKRQNQKASVYKSQRSQCRRVAEGQTAGYVAASQTRQGLLIYQCQKMAPWRLAIPLPCGRMQSQRSHC